MKKNTIIAVIGLLLFVQVTNVIAQKFRPGYIITKDGRKASGFIKISTLTESALGCSFATNDTGEPGKMYDPKDLKGYGYDEGSMYESKMVKFYDITEAKEVEQTLFLEVLAKGKVNLYYFKDDKPLSRRDFWHPAHHYYIQKDGGEIPELKIRGRVKYQGGKKFVSTTKLYIGTLNYTLTECPDVKKKFNSTKLSRKSLKKLINAYNTCVDPTSQTIVKDKRQTFNLAGLSVNYFSSTLAFSGGPAERIDGFPTSNGIGLSAVLMLGLDRNQLVFLESGLNFMKRNYTAVSTNPGFILITGGNQDFYEEYDYNLSVLQIPMMFTFATPGKKLQTFVGLGTGFNFKLAMTGTLSESGIIANNSLRTFALSYLFAGGLRGKINKSTYWKLEGRWESSQEFIASNFEGARANIFSFGFGLAFKL